MKERKIVNNGYYHVYNRGSKRVFLFGDDWDCIRFIKLSRDALERNQNKLVAYCLMGNHYHFILRVKNKVSLSRSMHALGLSYATYYNYKYCMNGHVFQGRYNCKYINSTSYLIYLSRYLHRNPLELSFSLDLSILDNYRWSSYHKYIGKKRKSDIKLIHTDVLKYFVNQEEYREFCVAPDNSIRRWVSDLVSRPGLI